MNNRLSIWTGSGLTVEMHRELASRLASRSVAENTAVAQQIAERIGPKMEINYTSYKSKTTNQFTQDIDSIKFYSGVTNDQRRELLTKLEEMATPATEEMLIGWLSSMSLKTTRQHAKPIDEAAEYKAYAEELAAYPADVAKHALNARLYTWWPSVGQICQICDREAIPRRMMIAKLRLLIDKHENDDASEDQDIKSMTTPEERAAFTDKIMKQCKLRGESN